MAFDPGYYTGTTISGLSELEGKGTSATNPTAEQLRAFINNEITTADENVHRKKVADEFVAVYKHYGYIDNPYNGAQIRNWLQEHNHWHNPTIENFEEAFAARNQAGLIQLDQKKVQAEQARLLDARAAEIRENTFSLDKAEAMSTDELYRRGMGWK